MTQVQPTPVSVVIAQWQAQGWEVETVSQDFVTFRAKRPNHVLHGILTWLTVGLWGIVWLCIAAGGTSKRPVTLQVRDGYVY